MVLIGLAIQLFFFASFSFVAAYVHHLQQTKSGKSVPAQVYICLGVTIALITLRNIYRVIEMAVSSKADLLANYDVCSCWKSF